MRIAFLGSNKKEAQALNMYFLCKFAPKESLERIWISDWHMEYRDKNTGNMYFIQIAHEGIRGHRFNKIYYMDTISDEMMYFVQQCLLKPRGYIEKDKFIKLDSDLEIKIRE